MVTGLNTVLCQVSDVMRAAAFYRDVLGLTPGTLSPYWTDFALPGGTKIGLHPPFTGGGMSNGTGWILGIEVDDVAALRAALEAGGHKVGEYHDVPGGVVVDFTDLDGNPIQAIEIGKSAKDLA